jgi:chromosomal replication initiation ATPase DnaA
MKNLQLIKDLGYELQILQTIRFNTKFQFTLNELDKFVDDVREYEPEQVEQTEEQPISLLDLVELYGLKGRSRKQMLVYNRMLLSSYLKQNTTMTLKFIGSLFDLEHDTIIYYLAQYERLKGDKFFQECTQNLRNDLRNIKI